MISGVATVCGVVVTLCAGAGVTADTGAVVPGDTALAVFSVGVCGAVLVAFGVDAVYGTDTSLTLLVVASVPVTGLSALADVAEELAGVVLVTGDDFVVDASAGYVAVASVVVAVGFAATVCTT